MKIRVVSLDVAICPTVTAFFKQKNVISVDKDEFISESKLLLLMESHPKFLFQNTIKIKKNDPARNVYTGIYPFILFSFEIFKLLIKVAF